MTEELELVEKLRSSGYYESETETSFDLELDESAALIRSYGDRRVEEARPHYMHEAVHAHFAAKRLARWRDLCLGKIGFYERSLAPMAKINAEQSARIAELEAKLATVKDECADRAADYFKAINYDLEMTNFSRLRAAIKGE